MGFWIFVFSVAALFLIYPYIRVFFKRLVLQTKLLRLCKNKKYNLIHNSIFWFFGGKKGTACDFYIETPDEIYSVKLFGMKKKWSVLYLLEGGEYMIRKFIAAISFGGQCVRFPIDSKSQKLPGYNFRINFKSEWDIKTPHNILLINPVCHDIMRRSKNGKEARVGAGETFNGMEIYPLTRFLGELEAKNE